MDFVPSPRGSLLSVALLLSSISAPRCYGEEVQLPNQGISRQDDER
jgi:hypothetical protein